MIRSRVTVLAGVIALLAAAPALASSERVAPQDPFSSWRQDEARQETRQGRRISSSEALSRVRARAGRGHHLSISEERVGGGRVVFIITWDYENGRIGRFTVDGQTGRVSGG